MKNLIALTVIAAVLAASVSLADYSVPREDTYKTMALWNMNNLTTLSDGKVINYDQDTNFPRSNRHLEFFNGPNTSTDRGGTIVPSMSGFGNAASFDGVNDWARTFNSAVPIYDGFKIEFWVKLDSSKTDFNWIAEVSGVWRIYTDTNQTRINMYVMDANGNWSDQLRLAINPDVWRHITAGFENGVAYLSVDGTTKYVEKNLPTNSMYNSGQTSYVHIGKWNYGAGDRFFKGLLDDVRLTNPGSEIPSWADIYEDTPRGTYALYHFEEITGGKVYDDNSFGTRDGLHLTARGTPEIGNDGTYPAENERFEDSVLLDGIYDYFDAPINPNIDRSNFRAEAWVKLDADWYTISGAIMPIVWYGDIFRIHFRSQNGTAGGARISVSVWDASGNFNDYFLNDACGAMEGWNQIAFEFYEGVGKLYINNKVIKTATLATTSVKAGTGTMFVGGTSDSSRRLWGRIDEFRISNAVMPELECGDFGYLPADLNRDCVVDIADLKILLEDWLKCTADEPGCESAF